MTAGPLCKRQNQRREGKIRTHKQGRGETVSGALACSRLCANPDCQPRRDPRLACSRMVRCPEPRKIIFKSATRGGATLAPGYKQAIPTGFHTLRHSASDNCTKPSIESFGVTSQQSTIGILGLKGILGNVYSQLDFEQLGTCLHIPQSTEWMTATGCPPSHVGGYFLCGSR
jgi:hypothetical protein